jgi:hypothetical protein
MGRFFTFRGYMSDTKPVGRPSSYNPKYAEQARKMCMLLNATDEQLAEVFEVSVATIYNWKAEFPEFLESIKEGKASADANVAASLYERATGYSHPEVDIKVIEGQIVQTVITKHYPPDTGAAMAWLKNRQPKVWRDRQEIKLDTTDNFAEYMATRGKQETD